MVWNLIIQFWYVTNILFLVTCFLLIIELILNRHSWYNDMHFKWDLRRQEFFKKLKKAKRLKS